MIALYYDTGKYTDALALGAQLLKELKKLDDKNLLVEVIIYPTYCRRLGCSVCSVFTPLYFVFYGLSYSYECGLL